MNTFQILLLLIFFVVSGSLVWLVLQQEPKQGAGDMMGGSSTDLFKTRGVTGGVYRITAGLAVAFAVLAFVLSRLSA